MDNWGNYCKRFVILGNISTTCENDLLLKIARVFPKYSIEKHRIPQTSGNIYLLWRENCFHQKTFLLYIYFFVVRGRKWPIQDKTLFIINIVCIRWILQKREKNSILQSDIHNSIVKIRMMRMVGFVWSVYHGYILTLIWLVRLSLLDISDTDL